MSKPWIELSGPIITALPAQLGVYQVADAAKVVTKIGFAGGTEPFGLRSALQHEFGAGAVWFRHECTHAYMTRWQELLMVYQADHGELPAGNADRAGKIGTLSPGGNA